MNDRAGLHALRRLTGDARLLFATRFVRLFAYGGLSVVLVFHLANVGLTESRIGLLLTLTLIGDTLMTLCLSTQADRIGRRRTLLIGAALMAGAGIVFAFTGNWWLLIAAGTIGVISPSGHEVGPFLPIEQAALSHVVGDQNRTLVFAWYALAGSMATACGALAAGTLARLWPPAASPIVDAYRAVVIVYAMLAVALGALFLGLSPASEAAKPAGWRLRHSELRRLLVSFALRCQRRITRRDLFLGERVRRVFSTHGLAAGGEVRLDTNHGLHASAVQRAADPGAADADTATRDHRAAVALQHQPAGRSCEAVLHHGRGHTRGALRRRRRYRRRTHDRRGAESVVRRLHVCASVVDRPALLHRRDAEDRLRSAPLPAVRGGRTA